MYNKITYFINHFVIGNILKNCYFITVSLTGLKKNTTGNMELMILNLRATLP